MFVIKYEKQYKCIIFISYIIFINFHLLVTFKSRYLESHCEITGVTDLLHFSVKKNAYFGRQLFTNVDSNCTLYTNARLFNKINVKNRCYVTLDLTLWTKQTPNGKHLLNEIYYSTE